MYESQNGPTVWFLPAQKTQGFGSVRVTNPPRHTVSGFLPGIYSNLTEQPAKTGPLARCPDPLLTLLKNHVMSHIGVHEPMDVEYFRAQLHNLHLAVVMLLYTLSFVGSRK